MQVKSNEPSFHIPYLYDFSGQPWKTQRRVRQLMDVWYGDGPLGIPGDDDGGETSSWYVLSATRRRGTVHISDRAGRPELELTGFQNGAVRIVGD
jgi:hypothetical protein